MVIQYKCPKCGSDMSYDPNTRKLTCPNCGHAADIEKFPLPEKAPENDEVEEFCPDDISDTTWNAIRQAMHLNPNERPQSISEFIKLLNL